MSIFRRIYRDPDVNESAAAAAQAAANNESLAKFKGEDGNIDVAKLSQSYLHLEQKQSADAAAKATADAAAAATATATAAADKAAADAAAAAAVQPEGLQIPPAEQVGDTTPKFDIDVILKDEGLTPEIVTKQWKEHGSLTKEQYDAVAARGLSRNYVDNYLLGQNARAILHSQEQAEIVQGSLEMMGSQRQLDTVLRHVNTITDKDEKADILSRLRKRGQYKGAIRDLTDSYNTANGFSGSKAMVVGKTRTPGSNFDGTPPGAFATRSEALAAAKKYRGDGPRGSENSNPEYKSRLAASGDISKLPA